LAGQTGVISIDSALFLILGTNIGTCLTALLASIGASTNAKRAAFIHLVFNMIGTILFSLLLVALKTYIVKLLQFLSPSSVQMQIAYFHVLFNVITTAALLPFIRQLTWFAEKVIKAGKDGKEEFKLRYIDDRILHTPPIAVTQTVKEVLNMAETARINLDRAYGAITSGDLSERDRIRRDEQKINFINRGVTGYLVKLASLSLPQADDKLVGSLYHVVSDIERIGDHAENFLEDAEAMQKSGAKFSAQALGELNEMYGLITRMFTHAVSAFERRDSAPLKTVAELEAQTDAMKRDLEHRHIDRLNKGECSVESGTYFYALISEMERVADHLTNIAFSIKNPNGSIILGSKKSRELNAEVKAGGA
jgi:phosphate:Na+ symporter